MATLVARGRGKGIVVRTGNKTELGRISQAISSTPHEKTSMEVQLGALAKWLVAIAVFLCILIVIIGVAYRRPTVETIMLGVSLAVSVIPESLVAVVTVALAIGVSRMAKRNAIVRKLPAVESLGSVTFICSDKTGTLTEGKMGAAAIWTCGDEHYMLTHSTSLDPDIGCIQKVEKDEVIESIEKKPEDLNPHLFSSLMVATLCNNSSISKDPFTQNIKTLGDPTEIAMTIAGLKAGFSREWFSDVFGLEKIGEFAFDSDRKMMSVLYQQKRVRNDKLGFPLGSTFVLVKGAPEGILKVSTGVLPYLDTNYKSLASFSPSEMNSEMVDLISLRSSDMAKKGLRVLAFAMRIVSDEEAHRIIHSKKDKECEQNLTFIGLIGLIDPPK
jgi:Ca2+-transporting ATPase